MFWIDFLKCAWKLRDFGNNFKRTGLAYIF